MLADPPRRTAANPLPVSTTLADAPMSRSISAAKITPLMPMTSDMTAPIQIAWPVTLAAASRSLAPMRRETMAVTPIPSPTATA